MTFLILKIFLYLMLAGAIGFGAGWLLRNVQSQRSEARSRLEAQAATSKVPQLESLLKSQDDQIKSLEEVLQTHRREIHAKDAALDEKARALKEKQLELKRHVENSPGTQDLAFNKTDSVALDAVQRVDLDADDEANLLITELSREIVSLKAERKGLQEAGHEQAQVEVVSTESDALQCRIADLSQALDIAQEDLERERAAVTALESERALQNRSLKLLHQQLQHERSSRVVNAG